MLGGVGGPLRAKNARSASYPIAQKIILLKSLRCKNKRIKLVKEITLESLL